METLVHERNREAAFARDCRALLVGVVAHHHGKEIAGRIGRVDHCLEKQVPLRSPCPWTRGTGCCSWWSAYLNPARRSEATARGFMAVDLVPPDTWSEEAADFAAAFIQSWDMWLAVLWVHTNVTSMVSLS